MGSVVAMESANGDSFDDVLAKIKRTHKVTTNVISFFCSLYARCKELSEQKDELTNEIKISLLRTKEMEAAPSDSPYKLSLTVTDPKPVSKTDWEQVARTLAANFLGKDYEKERGWKKPVSEFTKVTTAESQVRLNQPLMNPNFKQV